jgi:hypothetical protein
MTPPRYITTPPTPNSLPDPLNAYLFGVFDNFSNLAIIYRVEGRDMAPKIDVLERKMLEREAAGQPLENNPKTTLDLTRPVASVVFQSPDFEEFELSPGRWRIRRKPR